MGPPWALRQRSCEPVKYETAVPVGRGATGEVFRAWDPALERFVALKLLRRDDPEAVERMLREARVQARIDHPNVCDVFEVGETDEGRPFISMQFVDGEPLGLAAENLSLDERVRLMVDVADAVQAAHRAGLIHRDLKPSNILVEGDPESGLRPYVVDFGIARENDGLALTVTGDVVGTPAYMSPEQARGEIHTLDRRSDIFSLGVILYELLGGRSPYEQATGAEVLIAVLQEDPPPLRKFAPHVPRDLETITAACMEKNPDRRFPSARALVEDLNRYLAGEPITVKRASWMARLHSWVRRHRLVAALGAVVLIGAPLGGLKYSLDVRAERRLALAAGAEAEGLMDFMLEDLYERLLPLGRTDLLEEVAHRALAHHERFSAHDRSSAGRYRHALAFRNLGQVLESQGDLDAAMRSFNSARDLTLAILVEEPDEVRWHRSLTALESALAETFLERGDAERSRAACNTAMSAARSLVADFGEDQDNLAELWKAAANTGWLHHQQEELDEALDILEEAMEVASKVTRANTADNEWIYRLSVTHGYRGMVEEDRHRHDAAQVSYREALALVEELGRREPDNARWVFLAELNHSRLGHVYESNGDLESAREEYGTAIDLARRLVARDQANTRWRRELGVVLSSMGNVLRRADRPVDALDLLEESLAISRSLATQDHSNDSIANDLAWDLVQVGAAHSALGDEAAATELWEEALALMAPIAERTQLAWYRDTQVAALLHLGRVEEARPLVEQLLASGWDETDFVDLARRNGLLDD